MSDQAPAWPEPPQSREAYISRLQRACLVRDTAIAQIDLIVAEARDNGMPWHVIAEGLDRSVQAVWHKYADSGSS